MRIVRLILIGTLLLAVNALSLAQDDLRPFSNNGNPVFSFLYPAGWSVEQDSTTVFYLEGAETTMLIEIAGVADDPFTIDALDTEGEPDISISALLTYYFGDADYSVPQTTDYDLNDDDEIDREIAVISDELEDIYGLYITPDYFALAFVGGEGREDTLSEVEAVLTTLTLGPPPQVNRDNGGSDTAGDADSTVTFSEGTATLEIPTVDGVTLSMDYPENLIGDGFDGTAFIQDESESFVIILTVDLAFGFELFGGEGNPETISSPREVLDTVLSSTELSDAINAGTSPQIEETFIGDKSAAILRASDENGDFAIIGLEVEPGILALTLVFTEVGSYESYTSTIEAILASVQVE